MQTHRWCEVGLRIRGGLYSTADRAFAVTSKGHRKELPLAQPHYWGHLSLSQAQALLPHLSEMLKIYWREIVLQSCWIVPQASRGERDLQAPTEGHARPACPLAGFWFPIALSDT